MIPAATESQIAKSGVGFHSFLLDPRHKIAAASEASNGKLNDLRCMLGACCRHGLILGAFFHPDMLLPNFYA